MNSFPRNYWYAAWAIVAVAYIAGLFIDIMDIDAAQYALIAKEMYHNHSYLEVYLQGSDYLDKPPLLFWTAVLFFKIFGVYDWAFRLPSILITILGIYSTYRFTKLYYPESTARLAALISASCQAFFLMNHDIRTDSLLTGLVSFTFWQMAEFDKSNKLKYILLAGLGVGLAMLSKGPIGLVVPGTAFLFHYLLNQDWKKILRWQYLPALVIIGLVLLPMSYGLYTQFDLHPEKIVYDLKGPSGLRFFYWTQSFGRITGEIYWNNHPDTFFLVHNFMWSFLPWSLLFMVAFFVSLVDKIKQLIRKETNVEWITTAGFLLIFIFLSMSNYQLPHYTFVIHPLAAIILASFIDSRVLNSIGLRKTLIVLFLFTVVGILTVGIFMFGVYFTQHAVFSFTLFIGISGLAIYTLFKKSIDYSLRLVIAGAMLIGVTNIILNSVTYPQILKFQSYSMIAKYVNEQAKSGTENKLIFYKIDPYFAGEFYSNATVHKEGNLSNLSKLLIPGKSWIVTDSLHKDEVIRLFPYKQEKVFQDYHVSTLKPDFLNPLKRNNVVESRYLLTY
ncbi:MAG TPA: glycosyltransferase family 39 protein [Saprospiraceae bacterium]|nr:glycosyltransferase family 39 protein [Saprospiraceae bacterium]